MNKPGDKDIITGHLELLYPSEYVKAADLKGKEVTVVISYARWENLVMQGGKRDRKVALVLQSVGGKPLEKRWIVGKTVLRQIGGVVGNPLVSAWGGQRVTLYPTTCRGADGKTVECIRVRVRVNANAAEVTEEMAATPAPRVDFMDAATEAAPEVGA